MCGDFTDPAELARTVRTVAPDVIVNAAAYTAVDKAESEPELARTINALAPGVLAQEALRAKCMADPLFHRLCVRRQRRQTLAGNRRHRAAECVWRNQTGR